MAVPAQQIHVCGHACLLQAHPWLVALMSWLRLQHIAEMIHNTLFGVEWDWLCHYNLVSNVVVVQI